MKAYYETTNGIELIKTRISVLRELLLKNYEVKKQTALSGDLSENVEYQEAKTLEINYNNELTSITQYLNSVTTVPKLPTYDKIVIGSFFKFIEGDSTICRTYSIVGKFETDPEKGLLNYESPTAKLFLNKTVGDLGEIKYRNGQVVKYTILEIGYYKDIQNQ